MTAYRLQFSIGQRTLLDVLNAENEYFSARSSEFTGSYAVTFGELHVLAAMGELLQTLDVAIDAPPQAADANADPTQKTEANPAIAGTKKRNMEGVELRVATTLRSTDVPR